MKFKFLDLIFLGHKGIVKSDPGDSSMSSDRILSTRTPFACADSCGSAKKSPQQGYTLDRDEALNAIEQHVVTCVVDALNIFQFKPLNSLAKLPCLRSLSKRYKCSDAKLCAVCDAKQHIEAFRKLDKLSKNSEI